MDKEKLTVKQETFCIEVIKEPSQSDAYRIAYNAKNMSKKQINEEASKLMSTPKISQRVKELKKALEGLDGDGGGHDNACGAHVAVKDFDVFLERFKAQFE